MTASHKKFASNVAGKNGSSAIIGVFISTTTSTTTSTTASTFVSAVASTFDLEDGKMVGALSYGDR